MAASRPKYQYFLRVFIYSLKYPSYHFGGEGVEIKIRSGARPSKADNIAVRLKGTTISSDASENLPGCGDGRKKDRYTIGAK